MDGVDGQVNEWSEHRREGGGCVRLACERVYLGTKQYPHLVGPSIVWRCDVSLRTCSVYERTSRAVCSSVQQCIVQGWGVVEDAVTLPWGGCATRPSPSFQRCQLYETDGGGWGRGGGAGQSLRNVEDPKAGTTSCCTTIQPHQEDPSHHTGVLRNPHAHISHPELAHHTHTHTPTHTQHTLARRASMQGRTEEGGELGGVQLAAPILVEHAKHIGDLQVFKRLFVREVPGRGEDWVGKRC